MTGRRRDPSDGSVQATPTASVESMNQERDRYNFDAVLDNEEIAALSIKPDDLIRVHPLFIIIARGVFASRYGVYQKVIVIF